MNVAALKAYRIPEVVQQYSERDCILYALGIGLGSDPADDRHLQFLFEQNLRVLPTYAAVMGYPGFWQKDPEAGLDWRKILHGGIDIRWHAPLPPAGKVVGKSRVSRVIDKGLAKGALVTTERSITEFDTGVLLATVDSTTLCRGDGGFDGGDDDVLSFAHQRDGAPHAFFDFKTSPRAALIYRLSGDFNPLHADPSAATLAGFDRPILHGLCSFGVAGAAILQTCCSWEGHRLKRLVLRFSAPVYPGETIRTEMWISGTTIAFRSLVLERGVEVLANGIAELTQ
jgi:acyl dehydratase